MANLSRYCRRSVSGPSGSTSTLRSRGSRYNPSNQALPFSVWEVEKGREWLWASGNDQQPLEVGSGEPHSVSRTVQLCFVQSHLQGKVDLVSDVLDDVALHAWVPTEFQHVPLKKMAGKANKPYVWGNTSVRYLYTSVWAYWKKLYLASISNLSMLIWNTLRPLVLCWKRSNGINVSL